MGLEGQTNNPPRNEFERVENQLVKKIEKLIEGNKPVEYVLGKLIGHYRAELFKRSQDLQRELRIEENICEGCPGRRYRKKKGP